MAGAGDGGGDYHQLDGSQCLLLDAMTTQMQQLLNRNNEELYRRIEGLEHQMNPNAGRPYGAGDGGGDYHQLDGSQCLLLDVMTTQMQQLLNRNNEELYRRIEGLEHQMNPNAGRPYGWNRRVNNGPNRIEGQDRIEGVKLNVPPFKGKSDPDAYLDKEMKI
ncbi:hypothetical protein GmHk_17G049652 [Glycine max]|nr:hypothetical protein GmHk_17G049652 [Glycine max]